MRIETWGQLLRQLAVATEVRRAEWRSSENGDAYVLSQHSGSVVLRPTPSTVAGGPALRVALLDMDGQELDEIVLGHPVSGDLEREHATDQAIRLLNAVRALGDQAENVATAIMDELDAQF
jgi:hypothetical protein